MLNLYEKPKTTQEVYAQIAHRLNAYKRCESNPEQYAHALQPNKDSIDSLLDEFMPHGSGIDNGVTFDYEKSTEKHLIFHFAYHFMDENGYYDGWGDFTLHVTPCLWQGYDLRITGKDRNDVKDYFYQVFSSLVYSE